MVNVIICKSLFYIFLFSLRYGLCERLKQTDRHTDTQTDRQTHIHRNGQAHRYRRNLADLPKINAILSVLRGKTRLNTFLKIIFVGVHPRPYHNLFSHCDIRSLSNIHRHKCTSEPTFPTNNLHLSPYQRH